MAPAYALNFFIQPGAGTVSYSRVTTLRGDAQGHGGVKLTRTKRAALLIWGDSMTRQTRHRPWPW
jgi:hypothetical protein